MGNEMEFFLEHTTLKFDLEALLALILLIAAIVIFVISHNRMKKQEEELQDQLDKMA